MTTRVTSRDYQTTSLCVDSYENGVPVGRFYNQSIPEGRTFQGLARLLLEMEQTLDKMDYPKSFNTVRSFAPPAEHETGPPGDTYRAGRIATFAVRILFRQNSSWQGSVTWLEGRQEQSFRSVLELILLLDSALSNEKAS